MELETAKVCDDDIEEGELSDSDGSYTPLQRPETAKTSAPDLGPSQMEGTLEYVGDSPSDFCPSSDTSSDSDDCLKAAKNADKNGTKKSKRTVLLRVKPADQLENKKARFKKYDIWTASLQEESLMENMRGIDVAQCPGNDRNVENYDYSMKYRLNGENGLKRRLSTSTDEYSDEGYHQQKKRSKSGGLQGRRSVKDRLGRKNSSSSCDSQNTPRILLDLNSPMDGDSDDVARDIANKLYEEKDDLLLRIVTVLGKELPVQIFKETQRIEKDGGMMIMNGTRRRTPGGVFLFLLKHHESVSAKDKKLIFYEERKTSVKERKTLQAIKRDRKVEELKKRLNEKEKELPPLATRAELVLGSHLKPENCTTLSNPPPSPVGQDNSPEYRSHAINHVSDASPEKPSTSKTGNDLDDESLTAYDEDFLDMNCDDMDLF